MVILCCISFASAIYLAHANPAAGYFTTITHLHELGMGGLLGVWAAGLVGGGNTDGLPLGSEKLGNEPGRFRLCRSLVATAGLAAIGGSAFWYTPAISFPGKAALVPILGAVAVIAAGEGGAATHAFTSAFAHPWLQYIGDISYSLYLAHWPVVAMYPNLTGRPVDGFLADGGMAVVASIALAHGCKRLWEDRFRGHALDGNESGISEFARNKAGHALAMRSSRKLLNMISRCRRSPLVGALFVTAMMASAAMSASLALHLKCRPSMTDDATGSDLSDRSAFDETPTLLNSSAVPEPHRASMRRSTHSHQPLPIPGCSTSAISRTRACQS